ncbi:hypothetical protein A2U01_0094237, partial [Trifolium medium]|nr:hypothetical protein [Trifolium medium]
TGKLHSFPKSCYELWGREPRRDLHRGNDYGDRVCNNQSTIVRVFGSKRRRGDYDTIAVIITPTRLKVTRGY